jgi:aquaporin Z
MTEDVQKIFQPSLKNKFLVEIVGTFILVYAIASAATVYSDSGQLGVIGIGLVHALA